jgi:hypothetical protein
MDLDAGVMQWHMGASTENRMGNSTFIAKRVLQLNEKANHNLQYPQFKNKLPTDLPLFEIGF